MIQVNYAAIIVGTVLVVLFSALYYFLLNKRVVAYRAATVTKKADVRTTITLNGFLVEFVRTFVLGLVIAYAVSLLGLTTLTQAAVVAFWLWLGFPVVLLVGLVMHEHMSSKLVATHAGDWLAKLLIFTILLSLWR